MGCYGIGTTRVVGAIVEASNDERGIIWPKSVAPAQIHLVALSSKDADVQTRIYETAEGLYTDLKKKGLRLSGMIATRQPGEKLADADLLGIPLRILISEKTLKEDAVEWKARNAKDARRVQLSKSWKRSNRLSRKNNESLFYRKMIRSDHFSVKVIYGIKTVSDYGSECARCRGKVVFP